ncbi:3-phosphoserine/phosphohydroxythreonine transaminase [Aliidiomarina halalkaliphila]|uniref:Phosphoserine aminotransferase n=1 Tax=Aliidiomarina halalkaliphila TaxID=2593535 RepID=A0A552X688_9GAMM|nr:3-phosphoserine/phosphohydroxythreonine transaminase [Aliidiomarina halalkaliphila]TRW50526.1 3-phosphoserine/phosphohydroxythreonine transaminase [Aliidiomarina halalkaliphila]
MIFNFSAGPAMLPAPVLKKAQHELLNWQGLGFSVMEISHRDPIYVKMTEEAEQDLRDLMQIPDNYSVLFMHGGGRGQFSAVPLNIATPDATVDYLNSGIWSGYGIREAKKYVQVVNEVACVETRAEGKTIPPVSEWSLSPNASYLHYCPNETVDGIALHEVPDVSVPVVADMSSSILSEPIDVSRFGIIYAGAQKNIGPSGLSVVIIRNDLLERTAQQHVCTVMNYKIQAAEKSMYNTPNTFAWYLAAEVFKWLKAEGGLDAMAVHNKRKSDLLYECVDNSSFYHNTIAPQNRSRMNIPFQLTNPELDAEFLRRAEREGLMSLKGHRFVGGMRASMYNAMPYAGAQALVDFMTRFANEHK